MLPKTRAYDKSYDGQIKWMFFVIEDNDLLENIMLFGIKWTLILKKTNDSKPVYNKNF